MKFSVTFLAAVIGTLEEVLVFLSAVLLSVKLLVAPALCWIALFRTILCASIADFVAWSSSFLLYLSLTFLFIFLTIFLAKDKNP